ncbi:hypothetical protein BV22DRAFT_1118678 [Leucogyrophana mollusca]|uniref:Uncharacterized protein n=1 Tax=Leucogyrophana mollusca TaxID=85980 RepID=A0ACB8BPK8_9AGAM|nr:hypothetical protein BV22DRAFT_1118678 [Leucogyrophana mollusca]
MSIRRKSTTHDLATLRLHPDGSRVQQSSNNVKHRTAKYAVEDARGNWIARDAGGHGTVKKRKNVGISAEELDREDIGLSSDGEIRHRSRSNSKGKRKEPEGSDEDEDNGMRDPRARKRRSFIRDLSFLVPTSGLPAPEPSGSHINSGGAIPSSVQFSEPSPELLKCIHHFASCYYGENGYLRDGSKDYRGQKKSRFLKNLAQKTAYAPEGSGSMSDWMRDSYESDGDDSEQDITEDERDDDNEEDDDSPAHDKDTPKNKDMYKAFDGSALVAIGMLLQEHIAHALLAESLKPSASRREGVGL